MKARVIIVPRAEVLDPQGKAVQESLDRLGFGEVSDVRVGKSFDIELDAADADDARNQLDAMCRKLLANQVMEDYEIHLEDGAES